MILKLDTVGSTQMEMIERVRHGDFSYRAVLAREQTEGTGRHGRAWFSPRGTCLALSYWEPLEGVAAHLVGMCAAIAAAEVVDCSVQWPNDLVLNGRKLGGVLATTASTPSREKYAVVGIGINLSVTEFPPEIAGRATSLALEGGDAPAPDALADQILAALASLPKPTSFASIRTRWMARDATAGKIYRLPDGRPATAVAVGPTGHLVAIASGETIVVPSAEAWLGPANV